MTASTDVVQAFVLDPKNPKRVDVQTHCHDFIANLPRDSAWRIEISPQIKRRTEQQSRTFHMWCNQIAKQLGWSPVYAKAFCKGMFGPLLGEVRRGDQLIELVKSTADYTVHDMSETMRGMQIWASEQGIELTIPEGEQW